MKRIALITVIAAAFTLSGCETMHGIGQDISDGWHSMTGSDSSDNSSAPAHTDGGNGSSTATGTVHDTNGGGNP